MGDLGQDIGDLDIGELLCTEGKPCSKVTLACLSWHRAATPASPLCMPSNPQPWSSSASVHWWFGFHIILHIFPSTTPREYIKHTFSRVEYSWKSQCRHLHLFCTLDIQVIHSTTSIVVSTSFHMFLHIASMVCPLVALLSHLFSLDAFLSSYSD